MPLVVVLVSVMLVALSVQVRLPVVVSESVTVPVNPPMAVTVIVEEPATPASTVTLVGLAVTVKSCTLYVTRTVFVIPALVPVTVTV